MAYPCDLPANMGNTDILRAIYSKISDSSSSSTKIEEQLDYVIQLINDVNYNIETNTRTIDDISSNLSNVNDNIKQIVLIIDKQNQVINNLTLAINTQAEILNGTLNKLTEAIRDVSINVKVDTSDINDSINHLNATLKNGFEITARAINHLKPRPVPPPPPPPPFEPDVIFYPVTMGLPAPMFCSLPACYKIKPRRKKCECKPKETKYDAKVFVKPEQRPNYESLNPNLNHWKAELERTYHTTKIRYPN